jgi:PAS domain S-box-containing protein
MAQEMGNGWAEGVHPDDFERCLDTYVTAFDARREFSMEYRLRRHDGEYRWLIDNGVPRFDDAGVFAGYIGSCIDISDRKQAELALKESEQALRWNEERLRSMFSTMVEGVVFQHKDGTIMDANVAAEKMLKLSRDELLGRTSMDPVWSPIREDGSDFPGQEHPSMVTLRTGMPLRDQVMGLQRNSGETRWISINSQPLLLPGNPLPEAVVTSFTDITDRKAAETERRRLAKIIEDAPDFIAMSDMKSNLKYLNAAGAQMVGLEADFDLAVLQIKDMHPKWAAQRVLFEGIPAVLRHGVWESENALLNRDGHEVPVSQMLLLHRDEAGNPQYLSTIMRDISLLKTREKELDVSRVAAEQANVAKSRFLATMSHEIRTPMNGILGMAQLLLVAELSERSRRDYARTILSSGQTLLMLLNDILDLSKIEAGQLQLEQIVFDPAALLQETETLFSGAAQTKGLRLDCKWRGPAQGRYSADAYRIRQMVSNLVGNAVKFTAQGHIHIEGRELEHAADVVVLEFSVADTGMGIPPDKIDLLFKPFSQTDTATTREFGGTGLGLSIVSNLAKAMGGSVGVESTQGKGSRFWFRLRCRQVDASEESRSAERANPGDALDAKSQIRADGRALVVEDNAINCMVIESLLATMGVKVTIVNDGQQAVDAIRNGDHPNLIFMDLHMPVMDGYTATELIRQWELEHGTVRLPIIALTADAFAEDKQHCMDVGMDDFLTKPVEIETLRAALATWMPGRSSVLPGTSTGFRNGKPLEVRQFQALVAELKPLLMENIFDAYEQFMDLQALTAGTVVADEIDEMVPLMESLQFSLVVQRLDGLMERLSRSPS